MSSIVLSSPSSSTSPLSPPQLLLSPSPIMSVLTLSSLLSLMLPLPLQPSTFISLCATVTVHKKLTNNTGSKQSLFLSYLTRYLSPPLTLSIPSPWCLSSLSSSSPQLSQPPPQSHQPSSHSQPPSSLPSHTLTMSSSLSSPASSPPLSLPSHTSNRLSYYYLEYTHPKNIQVRNKSIFIFRNYLRFSRNYKSTLDTVNTQPALNSKLLKYTVSNSEVGQNSKFKGALKLNQFFNTKRRAG